MDIDINWFDIIIVGIGYLLLFFTSGLVVNKLLSIISQESINKSVDKKTRDTGFIIGKCENFIIVTFMLLGAFTALALIFAAKAIVRKEDMSKDTLYFLAGTMVNVTYSIFVALIIIGLLRLF